MGTKTKPIFKTCSKCGITQPISDFVLTKNFLYADGLFPACNSCIADTLQVYNGNWEIVDKLCRIADLPFIPKKWQEFWEESGNEAFPYYAAIFQGKEYETLGWGEYFEEFKKLKKSGDIEKELPVFDAELLKKMRKRWGANYSEEEFEYLENLYSGMLNTQNINGALQVDQAIKLCKISLEIDSRIREGAEIDKLLGSYDKLVKAADFTPKNVKNANDFDSVGEIFAYLEKTGWVNRYYDDVKKDIVDETIENIQNFCQRLYTNESGIGEEIDRRIDALKTAKELEDNFQVYDERYEDGFIPDVDVESEDEEFEVEI